MAELGIDCTTAEAVSVLRAYDADGNGLLDLYEFAGLAQRLGLSMQTVRTRQRTRQLTRQRTRTRTAARTRQHARRAHAHTPRAHEGGVPGDSHLRPQPVVGWWRAPRAEQIHCSATRSRSRQPTGSADHFTAASTVY